MNTTTNPGTGPVATEATEPTEARRSWWHGRGELSVGVLALVAAVLLIIGTIGMEVRGQQQPGPQFFPIIVICLLVFSGGWITVQNLLPRRDAPETWHRPDVSEDMLADVSGTNTEVIALESRHRLDAEADGMGAPAERVDPNSFDWRTFGIVLGAVVAFAVLLVPVGWILSAALLFWLVSYALGSRRPIFDIGVALLLSSLVQLAFSAGLGLTLPSGLIGWIF